MGKITISIFYFNLLCLTVLCLPEQVKAQVVIGDPKPQFTQACASSIFNSYDAIFSFSAQNGLGSSNQFILEMSDADGVFTNPTVVFTSGAGTITESPATINFSIPTTTIGEGYKIRVKSTDPVATGAISKAFPAYYKLHDKPFTINKLVSTGAYCPGGSYLLTIDDPSIGSNDSPLDYPSLNFNWYKVTGPTTSILVAKANTFAASEEGTYFAETDYGTCTSDSFSNRVKITLATTGQTTTSTIESSLGNPFCENEGPTTLSTILGQNYEWSKDGTVIQGATSRTYQTNESGSYKVIVTSGACVSIGTIDLMSGGFTSDINVPSTNIMQSGDMLSVVITTNAINPVFEWYLDEDLITEATENTYEATEFGNYKVIVSQTEDCISSMEFTFQITQTINTFPDVENIPNIVSPNGDGINDTWIIPSKYVGGTDTEIMILTREGKTIFKSNDYQNDWPQDQLNLKSVNLIYYYIIIPKGEEKKLGSITIVK